MNDLCEVCVIDPLAEVEEIVNIPQSLCPQPTIIEPLPIINIIDDNGINCPDCTPPPILPPLIENIEYEYTIDVTYERNLKSINIDMINNKKCREL